MRYVSIRTPASSIAGQHGRERQLDLVVERLRPALAHLLAQQRRQPPRGFRVAHERRGRLLRGRVGHELDAVLRREIVELVSGTTRVDEVRGEQRVVARCATEPERPRVVRDDLGRGEGPAEVAEKRLP